VNEERQLRLGLGQVLRYRDLVRGQSAATFALCSPEREPREQSWSRLCEEQDVILAFPPGFESLGL
jgi:hypothetical protein